MVKFQNENKKKFKFNFLLLNFSKVTFKTVYSNEDAKRLLDDLFSSYNTVIRPVSDPGDTIRLSIGLKLSQIADIVIF